MALHSVLLFTILLAYAVCGSFIYVCCKQMEKIPSVYRTYYRHWLWWGLLAVLTCLGLHQIELQLPLARKLLRMVVKQGTFEAVALGVLIVTLMVEDKWQRFPGLKVALIGLAGSVGIQLGVKYTPEILTTYPVIEWLAQCLELISIGMIGYVSYTLWLEFVQLSQKNRRRREAVVESNFNPDALELATPPESSSRVNSTQASHR